MIPILKGIDVSHWQGNINFYKVKKSGINFVIIKAGGSDAGFYKDSKFERYYADAKKAGLAVGAYYFVGRNFTSAKAGLADAKRFYKIIKGKQFEMPIYLDVETTTPKNKVGATQACIAFCNYLEDKGFYVGIYASDVYGFKERLNLNNLANFDTWVARYGTAPKYVKNYGMWQYSEHGNISGISGNNVDLDYAYINYPRIIKSKKFNGF